MSTTSIVFGTSTAIGMSLNGLASSATLDAGRQSDSVDNTSLLAVDHFVSGKVRANGSTAPTAGKQIEVWAAGSEDGSRFSAGLTGVNGNLTLTEKYQLRPLCFIPTDATVGKIYEFGPFSIAQAFGGAMPRKWSLWIVHNMGQSLYSTASEHVITYTPANYSSV